MTPYQKRYKRLSDDVESGKVQKMIDDGYTRAQIAAEYEVSLQSIRKHTTTGAIVFEKHTGVAGELTGIELWSEAKKLAMTKPWK